MRTLMEVAQGALGVGVAAIIILYLNHLLHESRREEYEEAVMREAEMLRSGKVTYNSLVLEVGKAEADDAADLAYGPDWAPERYEEARA